MVRFTKDHETIGQWLEEHTDDTPYRRRIICMNYLYPEASLAQLRGHPGKGEAPLYWFKPRQASLATLSEFRRLADRYAEASGCWELDEKGRRIIWRRPRDEPE